MLSMMLSSENYAYSPKPLSLGALKLGLCQCRRDNSRWM
jgi:hypothetical protein